MNEIIEKYGTTGTVIFPNKETFQEIYEKCLEHQPQATSAVTDSYVNMENVFNEYLDALQENMFRYAYQCGYEAAISQIAKGGVAADLESYDDKN